MLKKKKKTWNIPINFIQQWNLPETEHSSIVGQNLEPAMDFLVAILLDADSVEVIESRYNIVHIDARACCAKGIPVSMQRIYVHHMILLKEDKKK